MTVKLTDIPRFDDFFTEVLKTGISNVDTAGELSVWGAWLQA